MLSQEAKQENLSARTWDESRVCLFCLQTFFSLSERFRKSLSMQMHFVNIARCKKVRVKDLHMEESSKIAHRLLLAFCHPWLYD